MAARAARQRSSRRQGRNESAPAAYRTLTVEIRNGIALVALARPDVHNAFDETSIAELTHALVALERDNDVRAVVLLGQGASFCAGADLNWMKRMAAFGEKENLADAMALATLLEDAVLPREAHDRARPRRGVRRRRGARRMLRHRDRRAARRRSRCPRRSWG